MIVMSLFQRQAKDYMENHNCEGLSDALLNGVAHQFGIILEVQFLQNAGAVGTHRGRAEMHAFGDLRDRLP
jgi:hypothetical protein